jgi:hypothetical protein
MNPLIPLLLLMLTASTVGKLKVLSTVDGVMRPATCALTCTGVTGYSGWKDYGNEAWQPIDYKGCGFVGTPTTTVTQEGDLCPSVYIYNPFQTGAYVYTVENVPASTLISKKCKTFWTATGYTCN